MAKIVLYSHDISPPCRSVLMTAHAIGLELEVREINLLNKENMKEEYIKINPQHTIPTMDDNGFVLTDSHAIVCYLVEKYAKDDSLYPKDLKKRALINQRLHFDTGVHFSAAKATFAPMFFKNQKAPNEAGIDALKVAYGFLDTFLEGKKWLVEDSYTLADICSSTTASGVAVVINLDDYPNVKTWLQTCEEELPGYKEVNLPGVEKFQAIIRSILA